MNNQIKSYHITPILKSEETLEGDKRFWTELKIIPKSSGEWCKIKDVEKFLKRMQGGYVE